MNPGKASPTWLRWLQRFVLGTLALTPALALGSCVGGCTAAFRAETYMNVNSFWMDRYDLAQVDRLVLVAFLAAALGPLLVALVPGGRAACTGLLERRMPRLALLVLCAGVLCWVVSFGLEIYAGSLFQANLRTFWDGVPPPSVSWRQVAGLSHLLFVGGWVLLAAWVPTWAGLAALRASGAPVTPVAAPEP